jgi:hypothetical protein
MPRKKKHSKWTAAAREALNLPPCPNCGRHNIDGQPCDTPTACAKRRLIAAALAYADALLQSDASSAAAAKLSAAAQQAWVTRRAVQ